MFWAWLINSVSVFLTAKVLSGVEVKNFWSAVWVAAGISIINFLLGPILQILALPITILTFGLFAIVINAFLVMLVDKFIDGFKIKSFGWALAFTIILSIISSILMKIFT
ncbi:MAG: phage holin family protein [Balneolaceae bacterium]|nr:phage holin family protein [Balneolaceae bacterium]